MSQSIIHGLTAGTLLPGPDLNISRGPDGRFTAKLTFRCTKEDLNNGAVLALLQKGTLIADIYPSVPSKFEFFYVDTWQSQRNPGGYEEITVDFTGQPDDLDFDFDNENSALSYTRTTSVQVVSIFEHPVFKVDLNSAEQRLMKMWSDGLIQEDPSNTANPEDMTYTKNDSAAGSFESDNLSNVNKWAAIIVDKKILTWEAPVCEWTKAGTITTLIPDSEIEQIGQAPVTPDLSPTPPNQQTWRLTAINEDIAMAGASSDVVASNAYSKTWTSGFWNVELFDHENFGPST